MAHSDSQADDGVGGPIEIASRTKKWRFRCPHGHTDWRVINGYIECRTCRDHDGADPIHDELHDLKRDEMVSRDRIELVVEQKQIH